METKIIKILAIDDIQDNLITLKALISEAFQNVKVFTSMNGSEAIEIAKLEAPDVILLDILMPEMDGFEVCEKLKSDNILKEIPVVFITALKGDKATRIKALEVGAEAFLAKPIDESELIAQINAMVKIKEANIEKLNKEKLLLKLVAEKTKELVESNKKAVNLLDDLIKENEARKLTEQAVIESEDKYSKAFQTSPYCITITSLSNGTFVDVNDSFCNTTGYSKKEVIGNSVENIQIWFNLDDRNKLVENILANKKIENYLGYFKKKNGAKIIGLFSAQLIEINGVQHILASINDITEQKLAEEQLFKSQEQYQELVTKIPVGVFVLRSKPDGSFMFEYVSPKMEEITQLKAPSILENPANAFLNFHPEDLPFLIQANIDGIASKKPAVIVGRLLINEKIKWVEISSNPEIQANGDVLWHGLISDITEQKLAEIAKEVTEQKFRTIIETSPDDITITDLEGKIIMVSPVGKTLFGLNSLEEPIGKNIIDFIVPQDIEKVHFNLDRLFKGEDVNPSEYIALKADGSEFNIEVNAEFIRDEERNPINILLIIRDITKRILAANELMNAHNKLEVLMDAIPDLLFEVGLDGTIYNYHTHSTNLLAAPPEVFIGKRFSEILPLHAANICQLAMNEASEKGISTGKQYSLQLPQGEFWFDISVAIIKDIDDKNTRYVFLARDVTEQKKSVLELVKLNRTQALNSQINDLIIRIHDKKKLFEEVCAIATTYGNFRMSWISQIDEQTNIISPVVWYGHEEGYLKKIQKISIENNLFGNGPTGIAFREGKVAVCNNIANDPEMKPWREEALKRGYLSSIALPIIVREKVIGTFNLYAGEVDTFVLEEEVELLENITANIAFSLEKILDEEDRLKAEQKVREKDIQFQKLSANVSDLLFQFTRRPDGTYFVPIASAGIINIFGCKPEDVVDNFDAIAAVLYPEDAERVINEIEYSATHLTYFTCEFRVQIPGKPIQWIYSKSNPEKLADGSVTWYGFNTDITERKHAEEKIRQNEAFLKETQIIANLGTYTLDIAKNSWESSEILDAIFGIEKSYEKTLESWGELAHPDWQKIMLDYFVEEVIGKKKMFDKEYKIIRQNDQTEHWVHGLGKLEFDGKNIPIKMIGTIRDITERKQAEVLLLRNTKLLEESQGIAKVGGWELDLILNKLYWTAETYKIHETSPEEFNPTVDAGVGYFLPESKQIISEALDQAMKYGIGYDLYLETYTTKGKIINVRTTCDVTLENGTPIKLTGIFQDITDIKQAEKALLIAKEKAEESENKLKVMVNSMPDLVWFKNNEGVYLECNQRFEDFIGYSQEKLIGKTDYDMFDKELADFFRNNDQIAMNAGKSTINEEQLTFASDGHSEFLETIKTPIYNTNKGIIGVLGIGRNITKRKIAEQKNLESLQLIEGIINTINIRVFWKDKNLNYLGCNKYFALDAGFNDPKELIGKDDFQMGWKDQAELYRTDDLSVIESGEAKLNIEEIQTTPDGKTITLLTNKIPIKNANNETYGVLGTYIDISERKKIEVDLLKSKVHLQTILESTDDGILAVSADNTLLYYNARFIDLWKIPNELIIQNNDQILIEFVINQLVDPQIFLQKVNELYNSNNDSFDILYFKDGRIFERLSKPMHLNGNLHGRVWSFRDITEQKRAELEKENNISTIRKLSVAIDQSPVTTVITDLEGKIIFVNPKFTEVTGYTFEEAIGQNPRVLNTGHTPKEEYKVLWETILSGQSWHGVFQNKKKNGELFWERAVISPVKNEQGIITNFLAVKEDITEKRMAELALIESNERYNLVAKATNDSIWDLNILTQEIVRSGNGFEVLFGYKMTENNIDYPNYKNLIHPDDLERIIASKTKVFSNPNEFNWEEDYRFLKANGEYAFVHDKGYIIRDENGKAVRMIGATQDVTEREQHIKAIEEQNNKLRDIAWLQSHVVRAPLSRMMGIVGLLKEVELNEEEFKTWVEHFVNSSAELDKVIHDISSKTDAIELDLSPHHITK